MAHEPFTGPSTFLIFLWILVSFESLECKFHTFDSPIEELSDFTLYNHGRIQPYQAYRKMLVASYRVPHDVSVGTWMMKAKPIPYRCLPRRKIHVRLQAGSIPLVNALNETFPDNFHLQRYESQHRALLPNNGMNVFMNVTHPKPGEWYLIAFYIDNDKSIKQQGLSVGCSTNLIVGLQFKILKHIPQIFLRRSLTDSLALEAKPRQDPLLFKFFVPETVISFSISVINCSLNSTSYTSSLAADETYLCPLSLSTRAYSLPSYPADFFNATTDSSSIGYNDLPLEVRCNETEVVTGSRNETYCVLDDEFPARGHWHYLNISRLDDDNSTVSFHLAATSRDCFHIFRALDPPAEASIVEDLANSSAVAAASASNFTEPSTIEAETRFVFCPSVVDELFKTEKENYYEYTFYPLYGNLGSRIPGVLLHDGKISFYSAFVSPRDDIGGTLKISLQFYQSTKIVVTSESAAQARFVWVCVTKDSVILDNDDESCERGFALTLDSRKKDQRKVVKYIPYPEAGKYYFKFRSKCVNISTIVDDDIATGVSEPCAPIFIGNSPTIYSGVLLKFNVSSDACIDQKCGDYGRCAINYYGKVQYSYCICHDSLGYRGYGCNGLGPDAPTHLTFVLSLVFLVGSNLAFLVSIIVAVRRRFYLEGVCYAGTFFFSTFYHACDQPLYEFCLFTNDERDSYNLLQFMDFVTALLALWVTVLAAADLPLRLRLPIVIIGAILVPALTFYDRFLLQTIAIPLGLSIAVLAISWTYRCYRMRKCFPRRHYSLKHMTPGAVCGIAGIVCFTQATKDNYFIIHSLWHLLMATAITCLLPCINKLGGDRFEVNDICNRDNLNVDTESTASAANGSTNQIVSLPYALGRPAADSIVAGRTNPIVADSGSAAPDEEDAARVATNSRTEERDVRLSHQRQLKTMLSEDAREMA